MKKLRLLLGIVMSTVVSLVHAVSLPGPVVSAEWLANNRSEVQVVEVRGNVDGFTKSPVIKKSEDGKGTLSIEVVGGHIPDAALLDFKKVRAERQVDGKRVKFLIPERGDFEKLIQSIGVNSDKPIVLVPVGQDMADIDEALRAYWQFKVYGEDQIAVLDGGYAGWLIEGRVHTTDKVVKPMGNWVAKGYRSHLIATSGDVAAASEKGAVQLMDARPPAQFTGLVKRPDVLAYGHIQGGKQFAPELMAKPVNGALYFHSKNTYDALLAVNGLNANAKTISYCNTGHLAAGGWFIMSELVGNETTKLYDGSLYLWTMEGRPLIGVPLK